MHRSTKSAITRWTNSQSGPVGLTAGVCPGSAGPSPAVGGVVMPVNKIAVLSSWLVVIGLFGGVAVVVVIVEKRSG